MGWGCSVLARFGSRILQGFCERFACGWGLPKARSIRKSSQSTFEKLRKSVESWSRRLPEGLQDDPGRPPADPSARFHRKRAFSSPTSAPHQLLFMHFWPHFGVRPEPGNRQKIEFWPKSGRCGAPFCRFLSRAPTFSISPSISPCLPSCDPPISLFVPSINLSVSPVVSSFAPSASLLVTSFAPSVSPSAFSFAPSVVPSFYPFLSSVAPSVSPSVSSFAHLDFPVVSSPRS